MMMMMTTMTMIEIMTRMMTKIKMRLRQTFDDKTEEIQARDDSPAWISLKYNKKDIKIRHKSQEKTNEPT